MSRPRISVVVPMRNPGPECGRMLQALTAQRDVGEVEVVVVDSGSDARALEVIRSRGVQLLQLPSAEFSHSHARNLGARHARGELLLFTVQDALPSGVSWLRGLATALQRLEVAALSCREEPRPDADLFYRVMSWAHTRFLSPHGGDVVLSATRDAAPVERRRQAQLSDVACLIRREVFDRFEYRGDYAEDLDLGLRLTKAGHRLAFLTSVSVLHSHNRSAWYHLRRGYVDQRALLRILPGYPATVLPAAAVAHELHAAYLLTDHLARRVLAGWPSNGTWDTLADTVLTAFAAGRHGIVPGAAAREVHGYIDEECLDILQRLSGDPGHDGHPRGGALLHAIPAFLTLVFEHVAQGAEPIDAFALEDFKSLLYKAWAFQSGVLLAGTPAHGRDAPAGLPAVHQLLARDI